MELPLQITEFKTSEYSAVINCDEGFLRDAPLLAAAAA